ncbi:MAG: CPBP family intramembrane metalloprotease [Kordiimonadaceae bacterium]|nr:CPBP family intramembrane metalloprotease [Kordiimonadaceae bacterium]MBO6570622.1 CPBP family intramembrane metalloprotease [Kordiimonadaceae bacterium]MBO6966520.1 CPBP family intramembrane metalloprotease [Kordiimonadaceae bacterium]
MNDGNMTPARAKRPMLYPLAFAIFGILLAARESSTFAHWFEIIPILGGNIPFFTLAMLLAYAYCANGGSLATIGLRWPSWNGRRPLLVLYVLLAALLIFAARAGVALTVNPLVSDLGPLPSAMERMAPLIGNFRLLLVLLPVMWLAVIGEELLFRGLLLNFFASRFGGNTGAWLAAIVVSALIFGIGHFWQGPRGMILTGAGALVYGAGYYLSGRNLWPPILAHAIANTLGFVSIYMGDTG